MTAIAMIVPNTFNLSNPIDFLLALYHVETWPVPAQWTDARFDRDFAIVSGWLPAAMCSSSKSDRVKAIEGMIAELANSRRMNATAPREWLAVFREAFGSGLICDVAWGAAVVNLLTVASGNGSPQHAANSIEAKKQMLGDVRTANPDGLMTEDERAAWEALPPKVVAYRGGCTDTGGSDKLPQAYRGLHWALKADLSTRYMRQRGHERTKSSISKSLASMALRLSGVSPLAVASPAQQGSGFPFLIRAELPRSAVLAYCVRTHISKGGRFDAVELLVDFERITPDMVTEVTPNAYRWAA